MTYMAIHPVDRLTRLSFAEWRQLNPNDFGPVVCPRCGGYGTVEHDAGVYATVRICPRCAGDGELNDEAAARAVYNQERAREDALLARLCPAGGVR